MSSIGLPGRAPVPSQVVARWFLFSLLVNALAQRRYLDSVAAVVAALLPERPRPLRSSRAPDLTSQASAPLPSSEVPCPSRSDKSLEPGTRGGLLGRGRVPASDSSWTTRLLLTCFLVLTLPGVAWAGSEYRPGIYSIPLSNMVIEGELHIPGCDAETFQAREGTMITVKGDDFHYAFAPKLTKAGDVEMVLLSVKTIPGPDGGEFATVVGLASSAVGHFALDTDPLPFDIQVVGVSEREFKPQSGKSLRNQAAAGTCCTSTCNGIVICGCGVDTGCGFCCTGACCDEQPSGPLQKQQLRALREEP